MERKNTMKNLWKGTNVKCSYCDFIVRFHDFTARLRAQHAFWIHEAENHEDQVQVHRCRCGFKTSYQYHLAMHQRRCDVHIEADNANLPPLPYHTAWKQLMELDKIAKRKETAATGDTGGSNERDEDVATHDVENLNRKDDTAGYVEENTDDPVDTEGMHNSSKNGIEISAERNTESATTEESEDLKEDDVQVPCNNGDDKPEEGGLSMLSADYSTDKRDADKSEIDEDAEGDVEGDEMEGDVIGRVTVSDDDQDDEEDIDTEDAEAEHSDGLENPSSENEEEGKASTVNARYAAQTFSWTEEQGMNEEEKEKWRGGHTMKCPHCDYMQKKPRKQRDKFKFQVFLWKHRAKKHPDKERVFECKCGMKTAELEHLEMHMTMCEMGLAEHTVAVMNAAKEKVKDFHCKYCDFKGHTANKIYTHIATEHPNMEEVMTCKDARCDFVTVNELHMRIHLGKCALFQLGPVEVQEAFVTLEFLQQLADEFSNTLGATNRKLKADRVRNPMFTVKCKLCGMFFQNSSAVKSHVAKMHPKTPLPPKCVCGLQVMRKNQLYRHLANRHPKGHQVFVCEAEKCNFKTIDKEDWDQHCLQHYEKVFVPRRR